MKVLKYAGAAVLVVVGLAEMAPIYLISSGLLLGQGGEDKMYFLGKLGAHILIVIVAAVLATQLYRSASNTKN